MNRVKNIARAGIVWLIALACVPGGVLWTASPLGIFLSEQSLTQGSDAFWMLFPSAPLLLGVGVIGLWRLGAMGGGWATRITALLALLGAAMVIVGIVGQFWLDLDETFTILAPAYRTFRAGLVVLALGALLIGLVGMLKRSLPAWGALPFMVAAVCGLIAFSSDLGTLGAGLWAAFGAGWCWLGFSVLVSALAGWLWPKRFGGAGSRPAGEAG